MKVIVVGCFVVVTGIAYIYVALAATMCFNCIVAGQWHDVLWVPASLVTNVPLKCGEGRPYVDLVLWVVFVGVQVRYISPAIVSLATRAWDSNGSNGSKE